MFRDVKQAYKHGWYYRSNDISHSVVPGIIQHYRMECKSRMDKDAVEKVRAGHPVVAIDGGLEDFTKNGHFVVLTGIVNKDKCKIADLEKAFS